MVTGGRDTNLKTLDTTELLIEGAASWIISEKKLPTRRDGLTGVSINNKIFMTGTVKIAQYKKIIFLHISSFFMKGVLMKLLGQLDFLMKFSSLTPILKSGLWSET